MEAQIKSLLQAIRATKGGLHRGTADSGEGTIERILLTTIRAGSPFSTVVGAFKIAHFPNLKLLGQDSQRELATVLPTYGAACQNFNS